MTTGWLIVSWLLVSYWISAANPWGWGFWPVAIGIGVLYGLYRAAQHYHWFGGSSAPASSGTMSSGLKKVLVGYTTWTLLMMVGTALIGVSNNYAFTVFLTIGSRSWLHPSGFPTDILAWVAMAFLFALVAGHTATGRYKAAAVIFGVTLAILIIYREAPRTFEAVRPKPTSPVTPRPGESQAQADADAAAAEGRGIGPVTIVTGKKALLGDNVAKRTGKAIGGTVVDFAGGLFSSLPSLPSFHSSPAGRPGSSAPAPAAPIRTCVGSENVVFSGTVPATGQSLYLCPGWRDSVRGGDITITTQTGTVLRDGPGVLHSLGAQPEGWYKVELADPTIPASVVFWSRPR